jgi:hypothetical protein
MDSAFIAVWEPMWGFLTYSGFELFP